MARLAGIPIVLIAGLLAAQTAANQMPGHVSPDLRFEVATIKPSKPQDFGGIRPAAGGQRYEALNCTLKLMIQVAYRVKPDQIVGPASLDDRFDVIGQAERPSNIDELHVMLVNLLLDRFHMRFHKEKRDMPFYALTVADAGPKMTPHNAANAGDVWIDEQVENILQEKMGAAAVPMEYLAFRLSMAMDRPVVDLTNLQGGYDFKLDFTRDPPPGIDENTRLNGQPLDASGPTVFAAVKQQLGLELKPRKGPVDVIVVDHIEKPSEN
jgi:uncharacterized protein (TIGR03435 family)